MAKPLANCGLVGPAGLEPATSSTPRKRATTCATARRTHYNGNEKRRRVRVTPSPFIPLPPGRGGCGWRPSAPHLLGKCKVKKRGWAVRRSRSRGRKGCSTARPLDRATASLTTLAGIALLTLGVPLATCWWQRISLVNCGYLKTLNELRTLLNKSSTAGLAGYVRRILMRYSPTSLDAVRHPTRVV